MTPDDAPEVEDALRRVMAAALIVGQARGALYDRVEYALAVGADPVEVLRASGLTTLPLDASSDDEVARRRRRTRWVRADTADPASGHLG